MVEGLVRGSTNREIAAALSVGEHTVEWHLGHAFEKLGVGSRTRLLARFFHEAYLPGLGLGEPGAEDRDDGGDARS